MRRAGDTLAGPVRERFKGPASRGGRRVACRGRTAFTLLELLLALALAATVLAATSQTLIGTMNVQRAVTDTVGQQVASDLVLDSLAADLDRRLPGVKDAVSIGLDTHHRPTIEVRCLAAEPGDALHTALVPARVQYRLVRMADDDQRLRLVRTVGWLIDHAEGPGVTTTVCPDLADLQVELYLAGEWLPLTAEVLNSPNRPTAFRVHVHQPGQADPLTRTFLLEPGRQGDQA